MFYRLLDHVRIFQSPSNVRGLAASTVAYGFRSSRRCRSRFWRRGNDRRTN